jgi:hypothetical protein
MVCHVNHGFQSNLGCFDKNRINGQYYPQNQNIPPGHPPKPDRKQSVKKYYIEISEKNVIIPRGRHPETGAADAGAAGILHRGPKQR